MGLTANFIPTHLTLTANKGETVNLSMELLSSQKRDVTWKYNGKLAYTTQGRKFNILMKRKSTNNEHTCFQVFK